MPGLQRKEGAQFSGLYFESVSGLECSERQCSIIPGVMRGSGDTPARGANAGGRLGEGREGGRRPCEVDGRHVLHRERREGGQAGGRTVGGTRSNATGLLASGTFANPSIHSNNQPACPPIIDQPRPHPATRLHNSTHHSTGPPIQTLTHLQTDSLEGVARHSFVRGSKFDLEQRGGDSSPLPAHHHAAGE